MSGNSRWMGTHWMGTPRAAGFVAGGWCWAAATLALQEASPTRPVGTELVRWLGSAGFGPEFVPLAIAVLAVLLHAIRIRQAEGACCREWIDAAWSLGLIAGGIAAWSWAVRYEPFADPFAATRCFAAVVGLGAIVCGSALTVSVVAADERAALLARAHRPLRRSYEAIG
jgi:hypothetical protein